MSLTKKLIQRYQIRPWVVNNNELADFISRVPDNEELVSCKVEIIWSRTGCIWINFVLDQKADDRYLSEKLQRDLSLR